MRRRDTPELVGQRLTRDLSDRPRQLNAGRSAADDDERQEARPFGGIDVAFGDLIREQHPPPDLQRIVQRLETRRELRPFRVAEVRVRRARRDNQVVVVEMALVEVDALRVGVDALRIGEQDSRVLLMTQNPTDGRCDIAW